ncbi:Very-long-chain 3-ketoacyl-CoA synthase [Parasponia andersonii]|uniref:Very-long-chain 3-ketoacyl-CoA synthase n=1 Tax=Parasponia andersonii TaxID=3476 RepID=A0A2P5APT6_PARAD|nr:Very-long-chain 3-ketoacyl-CoA synthase [Parasponia andersonii]
MALFPIMDDLLAKTKLSPPDIDILILNFSGFCSSPSLPSILINILQSGPAKVAPQLPLSNGQCRNLLTSKKEAKKISKYQVVRSLRIHRAFEDKAYLSAIRGEDSRGNLGVTPKRDLLQVAGETLRSHITVLGSSLLPFREKFRHGVSVVRKRFLDKSEEVYVPDFKTVVQHFCLPTSGASVIRERAKGLKLG